LFIFTDAFAINIGIATSKTTTAVF
jgi:hypothetical protein